MRNAELLILAGGKSSRMGFPKGLLPLGDSSFIKSHILGFREIGQVTIVLGFSIDEYKDHLKTMNELFKICINKNPQHGQFSSIQVGLKQIISRSFHTPIFIQPVDTHPVSSEIYLTILNKFNENIAVVKPIFSNKGGHPVLISRDFALKLVKLDENSRLDHCINNLPKSMVKLVDIDNENILSNINTL